MAGENKLEVDIVATDDATPDLKKAESSIEKAAKAVKKLSEAAAGSKDDLAGLEESERRLTKTSDALAKASSSAASQPMWQEFAKGAVAANLATFAVQKIGEQFSTAMKTTGEYQGVASQLNAVIKSTGGAAGVTADEITKMASELSSGTAVSKTAVLSADAMLLTFTNIGKNVLPGATQAALDLATAMRSPAIPAISDMKQVSIMLGKALNDPIQGVSALREVGVTFSSDQEKVIKKMVETGDAAGAQKIILDELNKEFGGSAAAAASTYAGKMETVKNRIDNLRISVGKGLDPVANLSGAFVDLAESMVGTEDPAKATFYAVRSVTEAVAALSTQAVKAGAGIGALFTYLTSVPKGALAEIRDFFTGTNLSGKAIDDMNEGLAKWQNMITGSESALEKLVWNNDQAAESLDRLSKATNENSNSTPKTKPGPTPDEIAAYKRAADAVKNLKTEFSVSMREMGKDSTGFTRTAGDNWIGYSRAVRAANDAIARNTEDTAKRIADSLKSGTEDAVTAYEDAQSKLSELQEKQRSFWGGKESTRANGEEFDKIGVEIRQVMDAMEKNEDLASLADKDSGIYGAKGGTALDAISAVRSRTSEVIEKIREEGKMKDAELTKQLGDERQKYVDTTGDLVKAINDRYDAANAAIQDKYSAMLDTVKSNVALIRAAEAELAKAKSASAKDRADALAATDSPTASAAAIAASNGKVIVPVAGARAGGGPVSAGEAYLVGENGPEILRPRENGTVIPNGASMGGGEVHFHGGILQGANVTVRTHADIDSITNQVTRKVARLIQSKRSGLATQF